MRIGPGARGARHRVGNFRTAERNVACPLLNLRSKRATCSVARIIVTIVLMIVVVIVTIGRRVSACVVPGIDANVPIVCAIVSKAAHCE